MAQSVEMARVAGAFIGSPYVRTISNSEEHYDLGMIGELSVILGDADREANQAKEDIRRRLNKNYRPSVKLAHMVGGYRCAQGSSPRPCDVEDHSNITLSELLNDTLAKVNRTYNHRKSTKRRSKK